MFLTPPIFVSQTDNREVPIAQEKQVFGIDLNSLNFNIFELMHGNLVVEDSFDYFTPSSLRPKELYQRVYPYLDNILYSIRERQNKDLTCNGISRDPQQCSPFSKVMITTSNKTTVVKREYLQLVDLFGIIGGFFEVLWFVGVLLMGPYNRGVQKYVTV